MIYLSIDGSVVFPGLYIKDLSNMQGAVSERCYTLCQNINSNTTDWYSGILEKEQNKIGSDLAGKREEGRLPKPILR